MKKFFILILGLSLTAASCDLGFGEFEVGGSARGIFKSEDGGETYVASNQLAPRGDIAGVNVNSLVLDSSNPEVIYLGAGNGIFKSEDGAATWRYTLSNITVADIAIDPYEPDVIYAAGISGQNGKIIKSLDGGTSWVDVYTEPSKSNAVLGIAVARANSQIVLAGLASGQIIRSADSGRTWQAAKDLANRIVGLKISNSGTAYALTQTAGLYRSSDLGLTWSQTTGNLTNSTLANPGQSVGTVTAFVHLALDERQSGVVYLGTDQGLFRSVNDGANWSFMALPVKSGSLRVSTVAVDPTSSNNLYVSIGSTIFKSTNGGVSWQTKVLPTTNRARAIAVNPQSSNIIYLGISNN